MSYDQYGGGYTPDRSKVTVSAGTAFKIGFFGAFGAAVAWILVSIVFLIIGAILAAAGLGFAGDLFH
ncbi:hypothetical protein [Actinorhabdospora filicis]|nr:hypothetical protein [Actinorhabdospora filicis]